MLNKKIIIKLCSIFILTHYKYIDLDFWKNREQQFIHFHEQIDEKIGDFLTVTKSPCMDIYKQIIETTVTGKLIYLIF